MEDIVTIQLFGQEYSFKAESDISNARAVADYLENEVAAVEKQLKDSKARTNKIMVLALAALNISSDFMELRREQTELIQEISERSASLAKKIESKNR